MAIKSDIDAAIKDRFWGQLPEEVQKLISASTYDLYFGPYVPDEDYPGFPMACDKIQEAMDNLSIPDMYYDIQTDQLSESTPLEQDGNIDEEIGEDTGPLPEDIYLVSRHYILTSLLGDELYNTIY